MKIVIPYYKSNPYLLKNWKRQCIYRNVAIGNRQARWNKQSLCNWKSRGRTEVRVGLIQRLRAISRAVYPISLLCLLWGPSCRFLAMPVLHPGDRAAVLALRARIPKLTCTAGALKSPHPPELCLLVENWNCSWKAHELPGEGSNTQPENLPIVRKRGWELLESCDG